MADVVRKNPERVFVPERHQHKSKGFKPPPPDDVLPGLSRKKIGVLIGPGGVSKSQLLLQIGAQIAAGGAPDLSGFGALKGGEIVLFAGEEDHDDLDRRLAPIYTRLSEQEFEAVEQHLSIYSLVGHDRQMDVLDAACRNELVWVCAGARLVGIDTLRRFHLGDENDSAHMGKVMSALEYIAAQTGAAILIVHHVSKSSLSGDQGASQHAARGSTVIVDHARCVMILSSITEKDAERLGITDPELHITLAYGKTSYYAPIGVRWLKRLAGGTLAPFAGKAPQKIATNPRRIAMEEIPDDPSQW